MPLHLAILKQPYIDLILAGRKTVECRLTRNACAPFGRVGPGETILIKQSSGPIMALARAARVLSRQNLTHADVERLQRRYNDRICATSQFWQDRRNARYATLVWLEEVRTVPPFPYPRKGRQAWLVLGDDDRQRQPAISQMIGDLQ